MNLTELQRLFWDAVRADAPPPGVRQHFVDHGALDAVRRMNVYRAAYWARHDRCLRETYPRLLDEIGDDAFHDLVAGYIAAHPSTTPAIEWAGRALPEFVGEHPPAYTDPVLLRDLSALEWARLECMLAPDPQGRFDAQALSAPSVAEWRVRLVPHLRVLCVVDDALARLRQIPCDELIPERCSRTVIYVAMWRSPHGVLDVRLDTDEGRALRIALDHDATLAAVCAAFDDPDPVTRATRALGRWIERDWIASLDEASH